MHKKEKVVKTGFVASIVGLCIAVLALFPSVSPSEAFPWPLLVGSFIYLPGAFMVMIASRGPGMKEAMGKLRFVRLGFIAVFAFALIRLANG